MSNHLRIRISLSAARGDSWWRSLTKPQQENYLKLHPHSKYGRQGAAKPEAETMKAVLTDAPADRATWPDHIKRLALPPAWTRIKFSDDPASGLQAVGLDAKGRKQFVYSEAFSRQQAALKFQRVSELDKKFNAISKQNQEALLGDDPKRKDHAECLHLIMMMGLRPGGEKNTKAEQQAYGATTLEGRHVVEENGKVFLRFVGKKGVALNLQVTDKQLAAQLKAKAATAGSDGKIFPHVAADTLSEYTHSLDGGGFKTKDFRTRLGTKTANKLIQRYQPKPVTANEYKKAVRSVATEVSKRLGNTPVVALQSYIAPQVFSEWRPIEGIEG